MRAAAAVLFAAASLAACSSSSSTTDAPKAVDAKVFKDARGPDAKVFMDAPIPSSVHIVANCTGIAQGDIAASITAGAAIAFTPTTASIAVNQYVMFTSTSDHNMVNQPGAPADKLFVSGEVGSHVACLQFTEAGTYPWMCAMHGMAMTGTLTVN